MPAVEVAREGTGAPAGCQIASTTSVTVFAKLQISSRGELRHTLTGIASEGRA